MQTTALVPTAQLIQPFKAHQLILHASITIQDGTKQYKLRVQWRIERAKLIWVSIRIPWGLEIARARITPSHLELINHIARTHSRYDYATLQAKWPCPFTYHFLEAILLGELPNDFNHLEAEEPRYGYTIIHQEKDGWSLAAAVKNAIGKIAHWHLTNKLTQDCCSVAYEKFKPYLPGLLFEHAHLRLGHIALHITYTRVQWSKKKLKFPFSVPTKYAKL